MPTANVLVEVAHETEEAMGSFAEAADSEASAERQARSALDSLAGLGAELPEDCVPVPMFLPVGRVRGTAERMSSLSEFAEPTESADLSSPTIVFPVEVDTTRLDELRETANVTVWPNSPLELFGSGCGCGCGRQAMRTETADETVTDVDASTTAIDGGTIDGARSRAGVDCRPFLSPASIAQIRELLGVERIWRDGFRGQNVAVGILDEGIDGDVYPVSDGFSRPGLPIPGSAPITSHGSMCAADVLIAAPWARLYDYRFLGDPRTGGALAMLQAVLKHRQDDGTPQLTSNSYGFTSVPPVEQLPNHEIHDIDHPVNRKVREVVASGASCFFAAGNCGEDCPSGNCRRSGIGPGQSIHGPNALEEVITVAAANRFHNRIGYSSQGPGMFHADKPDVASYSHIEANFGVGRPGGTPGNQSFDSGTSASTPVAAGVGALLLSALGHIDPRDLKDALIATAINVHGVDWNRDYGNGIVSAAAAYVNLAAAR